MKIADVEAIHLRLPEVKEIADGTQDVLVVRVTTDSGISGLGEVVSCSHVARAVIEAPRSAPYRHGLAASVTGLPADDIEGVWQAMIRDTAWYGPAGVTLHAMSAIDMALWDIRGKNANKPVRQLISDLAVDAVPCYASVIWPDQPDDVARSVNAFMEQGYVAIKYGWGPMGPDPILDEELVAAARDALADNGTLMVDAGRAWDLETALERVHLFAPHNLFWLEEPLNPYDFAGFKSLVDHSPIAIATGEILTTETEFYQLMTNGKINFVQPDLGRVGGISKARKVEELAQELNVRPVPHAFGTGILLAASANWIATATEPLTEYTQSHSPLARTAVRHSMMLGEDGKLRLSDDPGLGVELEEEVIARYRMP